jgi:hypothetical protein
MATIEDLDFTEFSQLSQDEAIEHLRQIRLSRRTPVKKVSNPKPKMSAEQANALLEMLGDE